MEVLNKSNDSLKNLQDAVAEQYLNKDGSRKKKVYAVMLFATELELGISTNPNRWECMSVVKFHNGSQALDFYANTPNPASCILDSFDEDDLDKQIEQTKINYKDKDWLDKNLYPYL